jgi:UDP-N-acetylglucosamine--N-acetylmuramyl-(pentapeptide) pyrophosphoryl-undecaprenol N-acetylglucosamine transferase
MAIALANELRSRDPLCEVLFVGTRRGLESRILPPLGYRLATIEIGGLKKVGIKRMAQSMLQIAPSLIRSFRIVREFAPKLIVGLGGYSSGPIVIAGKLLRVPALIIEPNVYPGFTNRLLARWVDGAAVAFSETAAWFGRNSRETGIPTRAEFHQIDRTVEDRGPLRILIFGGSRGSHPINLLVSQALPHLKGGKVQLVHQTGQDDLQMIRKAYEQDFPEAKVVEYIDDMPAQFAATDLIVSRAGASTLAEITAAGKPAILIPFPHAADDHQKKNAMALADRGAALLLEQGSTTGEKLAQVILDLQKDRNRLRGMAIASKELARPESTRDIIAYMEELIG